MAGLPNADVVVADVPNALVGAIELPNALFKAELPNDALAGVDELPNTDDEAVVGAGATGAPPSGFNFHC